MISVGSSGPVGTKLRSNAKTRGSSKAGLLLGLVKLSLPPLLTLFVLASTGVCAWSQFPQRRAHVLHETLDSTQVLSPHTRACSDDDTFRRRIFWHTRMSLSLAGMACVETRAHPWIFMSRNKRPRRRDGGRASCCFHLYTGWRVLYPTVYTCAT